MCLNKIIGVSPDTSCCIDGTESLSGFYLTDQDEGYVPVNQGIYSVKDINKSLLSIIDNASKEAIREANQYFNKYLRSKVDDFYHTIGDINNYTDILPTSSGWYFIALKPRFKRGGYVDITGIKIKTQAGLFAGNIKILDANKTELYNGLLSSFTKLTVQLKDTFYIAYQSANAPVNFKHTRCCGYVPKHQSYVSVGSGSAATINDIAWKENEYCQGIEVECGFRCDGFYNICNVDFQKSKFGVSFAHAVKQIARKNFAYWLMTNDIVTPYVMVNKEELAGIIEFLNGDIKENMMYLPKVYNLSDCYMCREMISVGEILA